MTSIWPNSSSHSLPLLSALWEATKAIDESRLIPMEDSLHPSIPGKPKCLDPKKVRNKFEQSCQKPIVFGSSSRFGGCSTEFSHADTSFCGTNKSLWIATWPLLEVHGTRGEVARRSCCVPLRGDARPLRTTEHPHNRHTTSAARRQVHPCTRAVESGSAGPSVELSV